MSPELKEFIGHLNEPDNKKSEEGVIKLLNQVGRSFTSESSVGVNNVLQDIKCHPDIEEVMSMLCPEIKTLAFSCLLVTLSQVLESEGKLDPVDRIKYYEMDKR